MSEGTDPKRDRVEVGVDAGELLRQQITCADPARWMAKAFAEPDQWQSNVLRDTASRIAILAPRQSGKSQTIASKVAHVALYKKDRLGGPTTSLIAAPSERQSQLLLKKAKELLGKMGHTFSKDTQSEIILDDGGGQIVALPTGSDAAATARGYTVSGCLVVDEFGFVNGIDEVMAVLAPMITVHRAAFFAISSASFEGDAWHQIVSGQRKAWKVYNIDVSECPRLTPDVLEDLRGELGPMRYAREVLNQFSVEGFSPSASKAFAGRRPQVRLLDPLELMRA